MAHTNLRKFIPIESAAMNPGISAPMMGIPEKLLREFQFRFRNWDSMSVSHPPFLSEPFCLSRYDHEFLVKTAERMHPLMIQARQRIADDPDKMHSLGLDLWTQQAIAQELDAGSLRPGIEIARYDFFKTLDGGWRISEINNDVPSGFNESSFMHEGVLKTWQGMGKYEFGVPATHHFVKALKAGDIRSLAMLYGTAYAEDLQVCLFLKDHLETSSVQVTLASPSHLRASRGKATIWGQEVDSIYRIYPAEWFSALPNRDEWMRALRLKNLQMINPLSTIISQSKNFFSLLHANKNDLFTTEDWGSIRRFIPYTEPFASEKISAYSEDKDRWVLKPIFGRMGYDIAVGKLLSVEQWEKSLSQASKKPEQYCVQECFDIAPVRFSFANSYLCVGVFVINGRFSGYFTRASLTPLTTYEAMDVATVIELS